MNTLNYPGVDGSGERGYNRSLKHEPEGSIGVFTDHTHLFFFFRNKFALLIGTVDKQIRKKGEDYEDFSYCCVCSSCNNGER